MAPPQLSRRLSALLAAVRPREPIWDIGCDHARLGYYAVADGVASEAFLIDKSPAVIKALRTLVDAHVDDALRQRLTIVHADAAQLPPRALTGTVVIAGMGAWAMERILDRFVLPNATPPLRLVLQPAVQPERIRAWLDRSAFTLLEEQIVVDKQREHSLLIAERA
jgi:tRNA A22 N-methylase